MQKCEPTLYKNGRGRSGLYLFLGENTGSGNYGTGKNEKLRKELLVSLMHRYDEIISTISEYERSWPKAELSAKADMVLDSISDLLRQRSLREVTASLEMSGIIGHEEAAYLCGKKKKQPIIKEAEASSSPHYLCFLTQYKFMASLNRLKSFPESEKQMHQSSFCNCKGYDILKKDMGDLPSYNIKVHVFNILSKAFKISKRACIQYYNAFIIQALSCF